MPSLDLVFTFLMLPPVFLLVASIVVSLVENNSKSLLPEKPVVS